MKQFMKKILLSLAIASSFLTTVVPRSAYATMSCSVSPKQLETGQDLTIEAHGFNHPNDPYAISLENNAGNLFNLGNPFTPNGDTYKTQISIPSDVPTDTYLVQIEYKGAAGSGDSGPCERNLKIENKGGGSPGTGPNCKFVGAGTAKEARITVTAEHLEKQTVYSVLYGGASQGVGSKSDSQGNFSATLKAPDGPVDVSLKSNKTSQVVSCGIADPKKIEGAFFKIPPPCDLKNNVCDTALGRIEPTPAGFVQVVLWLGISVAGVLAIALFIYGGYRIIVSNGNPDSVATGRAIITSAIFGIIFILTAIGLLGLLAGNILAIPQFRNSEQRNDQRIGQNQQQSDIVRKYRERCTTNNPPSSDALKQCRQGISECFDNNPNDQAKQIACLESISKPSQPNRADLVRQYQAKCAQAYQSNPNTLRDCYDGITDCFNRNPNDSSKLLQCLNNLTP